MQTRTKLYTLFRTERKKNISCPAAHHRTGHIRETGPTEVGAYFPQAILADTAPVMEESASQLSTVIVTSARVQGDFMEEIAKKVNTVNC